MENGEIKNFDAVDEEKLEKLMDAITPILKEMETDALPI